ncbi:hypothetical protein N7447_004605 [Penicillium robsamsonii]|uniref:uncharacterized protein n=1 Tax=Penicillium robsamsonii TaxID=1792511 RepID=UPI0025467DAA|nr:uncharacterized protein N7447_004605 [Penicillium robsamsonii]KAJ5827842.1 hypothetical protein N7447_004605 [Penicillium robsamsonii]
MGMSHFSPFIYVIRIQQAVHEVSSGPNADTQSDSILRSELGKCWSTRSEWDQGSKFSAPWLLARLVGETETLIMLTWPPKKSQYRRGDLG